MYTLNQLEIFKLVAELGRDVYKRQALLRDIAAVPCTEAWHCGTMALYVLNYNDIIIYEHSRHYKKNSLCKFAF